MRPVVVVDTREQTPLAFTRLESVRGTLVSGDYSFLGGEDLFAVERKTVDDLTACCTGAARDRFFRELHRLRGFRWKRMLVVGSPRDIESHLYVSRVSEQAVFATLDALEARFDVPVVWEPSPAAAARRIETWAYWAAREVVVSANALARAHGLTRRRPKTMSDTASSNPQEP